MSVKTLDKNCELGFENIAKDSCISLSMFLDRPFYKVGEKRTELVATLQSETDFVQAIADNDIFALPRVYNVTELTPAEVSNEANDYGYITTLEGKNSVVFSTKMQLSTCMFKKLQRMSRKPITLFPSDNSRFQIKLLDDTTVRGLTGYIFVKKGLDFKTNPTDVETAEQSVWIVIQDNDSDDYVDVDYDPAQVDGLNDTVIAVTASSDTEVTFTVKTLCYGQAIEGLELADISILDSTGTAQVITDLTESNGVYTATVTTMTAGTYGLNLSGVTELGDRLYAPSQTPASFEVV